jgi:hypothetical protein
MSLQIKNQYVTYGDSSYISIKNLKNVYIEPSNNSITLDKSSYLLNYYEFEFIITPQLSTSYTIFGFNAQNKKVSLPFILYVKITLSPNEVSINNGDSINITAFGSKNYSWTPLTNITQNNNNVITVSPSSNIIYTASSTDSFGYTSQASVMIQVLENLTFTPSEPVIYEGDLASIKVSQKDTDYSNIDYTWRSKKSFELPLQYANITHSNELNIHPFFSVSYLVEGKQDNYLLLRGSLSVVVLPKPSKILDREILPLVFYQDVITRNRDSLREKIKKNMNIAFQIVAFYQNVLSYAYKQEFTDRMGANLRVPWRAYYNQKNKTNNFIITFRQQWSLYAYINQNQRKQNVTTSNYAFLLNTINNVCLPKNGNYLQKSK